MVLLNAANTLYSVLLNRSFPDLLSSTFLQLIFASLSYRDRFIYWYDWSVMNTTNITAVMILYPTTNLLHIMRNSIL